MKQILNSSCFRSFVVLSLTLITVDGLLGGCQSQADNPLKALTGTKETPTVPLPVKVSALGHIEPEGKIRKVSVSSSLSGDRIEKLLVEENQWVKKGQPLAILNSYGTLKAALDEANQNVAVAQSRLAQVKAGAKQGELKAQKYKIQSLQRQLAADKLAQDQIVASKRAKSNQAKSEAARYESLFKSGAISALDRTRYQTQADTALAELQEAIATRNGKLLTLESQIEGEKKTLEKIAEVRPVDVDNAQAELKKAIASKNRAQQDFSYATVHAPQDGQILKLIARPGDKVGDQGLLQMADTNKMIVRSEVYQTDLPKIFIGQKATITADGFQGSLTGTVYQIGKLVEQQSTFSGKPGENLDLRVVEVKIRLTGEDIKNKKVKSASNLQVNVVFDPKKEP